MGAFEPQRVKSYNVYIAGKMIGTLMSSNFELNSGDEEHITAEGQSHSDGTPTVKLSGDTLVGVDGRTHRLVQIMLNKEYVQMQVGIVDGKVHASTGRITTISYDTDPKTGALKGKFSFSGGKPDIL